MANRDSFRASLRAAVRGLWIGGLSRSEFLDSFRVSLTNYLTRAWEEGIAGYDLTMEDLSVKEQKALDKFIADQRDYADAFANEIAANTKAKGGALEPMLARVDLWVNRYDEAVNIARVMAGEDESLIWQIGKTASHCRTCLALNGWVKRASYWQTWKQETGVYPRSQKLICNGYRCDCDWLPTRRPLSRGRPPVVV